MITIKIAIHIGLIVVANLKDAEVQNVHVFISLMASGIKPNFLVFVFGAI